MLLLVFSFFIIGALAAPAPQLKALNPQPGANTRFVPLVVQVPEAAPGTFVPVVVSAPAGLGREHQPSNSSAVVFLVNNSQAEVSALLNGTTTTGETLPIATEATKVAEVEVEQTTEVPAILVESLHQDLELASVDAIETVRQQAKNVVAAEVAEVVAIEETELKADAQLKESISEAIAVEKAIEAADTQSVSRSIIKSEGSSVNTETLEVIATENAIREIDQAIVEQIQETVATKQAAEVAIEEKIDNIELIIETEQKIETAILEQVDGASVIKETVESVNKKPNEQISNNELTGKSLLASTSANAEAVRAKDEESQTPLPDALSTVMAMVLKVAQEHIIGTTRAIKEQNGTKTELEGANTQVKATPTVLISEVIPAIGGNIEAGSGSTQEGTEQALSVDSDSTRDDLTNKEELIVESFSSKGPSEIVFEKHVTESVSKTLDEAEQTVRAAEEIISTAEGSVTDTDSNTPQEQTIVHLEPVVTVLNDVVVRGKAISHKQNGASEVLIAQALKEETPVSVTVDEVVASESPVSAVEVVVDSEKGGEEIIVGEVSAAAAQDVVSVADLSTTLQEVLSGQAPDTSAVVIIPQELSESVPEEESGTFSANQAKEISVSVVAEESSSTSVSSATDDDPIEVAIGNSSPIIELKTDTVSKAAHTDSRVLVEESNPEVTVTASEAAPVKSAAIAKASAQVKSDATVEIVGPVESVAAVETPEVVQSVSAAETSAQVESVIAVEATAPVESVAAAEISAPVKLVADVDRSSVAKSQTGAEETSSDVSQSVSASEISGDVSHSTVSQSKRLPAPAQQNLLVGSGGRVVFGTSTFGSSVSPANFIIGQPVRVPQRVAIELAARASRISGTDQARSIVGPRFQQFIFDNDSPDVVAAKVNFFRARAASVGAPLALSVQPLPAAAAADAGPSDAA